MKKKFECGPFLAFNFNCIDHAYLEIDPSGFPRGIAKNEEDGRLLLIVDTMYVP